MSPSDVHIVELDVRPHLSKKLEPFQLIMDTVKGLRHEDVFVLHAPFKPTPLLGILKMKGYSSTSERKGSDHWVTTFVHKKIKPVPKHYLQWFYLDRKSILSPVQTKNQLHAKAIRRSKLLRLKTLNLYRRPPLYWTIADWNRHNP